MRMAPPPRPQTNSSFSCRKTAQRRENSQAGNQIIRGRLERHLKVKKNKKADCVKSFLVFVEVEQTPPRSKPIMSGSDLPAEMSFDEDEARHLDRHQEHGGESGELTVTASQSLTRSRY